MSSKATKIGAILLVLLMISSAGSLWAEPVCPLNPMDVNAIDRWAMVPYNDTLSTVSTLGAAAMMVSPALLAVPCIIDGDMDTVYRMGCEYALVVAGTYGVKELLKTSVARTRPYMYTDNPPGDKIAEGEWNRSFPSGHTSLSFAAASYATLCFCRLYPESEWKLAFGTAAYGGAAAVAALRVASGSHFITDVATGAALGTAMGLGVPLVNRWLHDQLGWSNGVLLMPSGVAFGVQW